MSVRRGASAPYGAALVAMAAIGCQLIGGIEAIDVTADTDGGLDAAASGDTGSADATLDARVADGGGDAGKGGPFASCVGLASTCGPSGKTDCCASNVVPGGTFNRSSIATSPATLSDFKLDVYEVTLGRFRAFVNAGQGTQASPPADGDGAHPKIANSGWTSSYDGSLTVDRVALEAALNCDPGNSAWTAPTGNEARPINCVSWFEAFAFCAWDGGRLPTEAESSYAAVGGNEQRDFPWGAGIDGTKASYDCMADGSDAGACAFSDILPVGMKSPQGDGKWGHADLAGNLWEKVLDWHAAPYRLATCMDCADLQPAANRVSRGGSYKNGSSALLGSNRSTGDAPTARGNNVGFRCARPVTP